MRTVSKQAVFESMIEILDLPDSTYQKAKERYDDIGEWIGRSESVCAECDPHVFPQGSFRLGTAIRPLSEKEEYDLDLACKLKEGVSKDRQSQEDLKAIVGQEIKAYRNARGVKEEVSSKHRCWRLEYADALSFHMDIVPCIPANDARRRHVHDAVLLESKSEILARDVSCLTIEITDDRHPEYSTISDNWNISNPQGYALWFESRMKLARKLLHERAFQTKAATIDELPTYAWKTPLQRCIQLLKRHRDVMFENTEDGKPISIIITTLAARAYQGESDIQTALKNILAGMGRMVNQHVPRVPNPVDPSEDFADRWHMVKYSTLNLEGNFWDWLQQVQADFEILTTANDAEFLLLIMHGKDL
ncbi:MAG: nucleotidyltransferase [Desulfobulbaceae bacterium]|nr:nucleotidyltransferase [Desulfobulbaceae bacterium]